MQECMPQQHIQIEYNQDLDALTELLESIQRAGAFYATGRVISPIPRLEVEGLGQVSFPVPALQATQLIELAEQAPYGRGEETVVDTKVRKVWQISPEKVRLGGRSWDAAFETILACVCQELGYTKTAVSAEFYKMLVYDKGGFFVPHRDTEKTDGMFGTMVIVLPSRHTGGELTIQHLQEEVLVDMSNLEIDEIGYAAFFADCKHTVSPILEGHRICLVYNLVQNKTASESLQAPDFSVEVEAAAKMLSDHFEHEDSQPKVAWLLEHQYSSSGLSFSGLKGADAGRASILLKSARQIDCEVHLGIVHIEESGAAEMDYQPYQGRRGWYRHEDDCGIESDDFEIVDICDLNHWIDGWVNEEDNAVSFGAIPLEEGELLPKGALDDEEPDEQHASEATGNEGATYERSYHRAALILWPRTRYAETLMQSGVRALVPYLRKELDDWLRQPNPTQQSEQWRMLAALASKAISRWNKQTEYRGHFYPESSEQTSQADMLGVLVDLGDPLLLEEFIQMTIASNLEEADIPHLICAMRLLDKENFAQVITAIIKNNMEQQTVICAKLLKALVSAVNAPKGSSYRKIAEQAARIFVDMLPKAKFHESNYSFFSRKEISDKQTKKVADRGRTTTETLLSALGTMKLAPLALEAVSRIAKMTATFQPDTMLIPSLSTLSKGSFRDTLEPVYHKLWLHVSEFLLKRSEYAPKHPEDWAQPTTIKCSCNDCTELKVFAADPKEKEHRFRVRKDRRAHLHRTIEELDMDMTHVTERQGSPHTLVCTKTLRKYENQCKQYNLDIKHFKTLISLSKGLDQESTELIERLKQALNRK